MSSAGKPTTRLTPYTLWDYRTIKFRSGGLNGSDVDVDFITAHLNDAGNDGWEVVSAIPIRNGAEVLVILKRPRVDE
jgi:hypothetical protein